MQDLVNNWWEAAGRNYQKNVQLPIDILYGAWIPKEEQLQLLGPVAGKHVLEIGCGGAQTAIACAKQGAIATGVDVAASQISYARELATQHGVQIDLLQRDMTDLSPISPASQDIVISAFALFYVDDISACFREVYRVLKPGGIFVFSTEHPFNDIIDAGAKTIIRSYFATGIYVEGAESECPFSGVQRRVCDYFTPLVEAGFVVEQMLEPDYLPTPWVKTTETIAKEIPGTLIFKARKPASCERGEHS